MHPVLMSKTELTERGIELIDIGANLTHKSFRNDLDSTIARAAEAGVVQTVVTGTSETESRAAKQQARRKRVFMGVVVLRGI